MQATVKYPANEPRNTKNGPRINAVVTLADGTEEKFWGNPGDPVLTALRKGQTVEVFKDKKGKWQLDTSSAQAQPFPSAPALAPGQGSAPGAARTAGFEVPSREVRENMLAYITFSSKLFRHCFDEAANAMQEVNLKDEDLRAVATTLYLSAVRRFDLQ